MEGVPAWKLGDARRRRELCKTHPALRRTALARGYSRQTIHRIPLHNIPLRQSLVQLTECLEVLWLEVTVHDVDDLLLKEPTGQADVVVAVLICRGPLQLAKRKAGDPSLALRPGSIGCVSKRADVPGRKPGEAETAGTWGA
eukprot:CAMPEP_0170584934 /NCGR_PEP_ID=MMETSP0224-20130122/8939_1 /TAXON_ID=285029 /ORGANISM="Togula jolla, Strain CCCM 725" /LENGTH=141 /DNA_ID=CAMNT_0010908373 /DNA_START=158 /DNA_END=581 /DNA_ORIENTATION=+